MTFAPLAPSSDTQRLLGGTRWLTLSTVLGGVVNYLFALLLTRVLGVEDYEVFAAGQALLLVIGTVAGASIPWVLAKWLADARGDRRRRRQVVWFALKAIIGQGLLGGLIVAWIATGFADSVTAAVVGASAGSIFLSAIAIGWLQGEERFRGIAGLRVTEVFVKALAGTLLALIGFGASGALSGFALGAGVVLLVGVWMMREDLRPAAGLRETTGLLRTAGGVVGIQGLVAVLAGLDHVVVALLPTESGAGASYQVSMILARAPLFVAGAVSMAVFPLLSRTGVQFSDLVHRAMRLYAGVVAPIVVGLVLVPREIVAMMFPEDYVLVGPLLSYTAVTGAALGLVNLLTTFFQADDAYGASVRVQAVGILVYSGALLSGFAVAGIFGFAIGSALGCSVAAGLVLWRGRRRWPGAVHLPWSSIAGAAVLSLLLVWLRPWPIAWMLAAAPTLGGCALLAFRHRAEPGPLPDNRPLKILHLGFEDHARPGSGGGALRTHEVNRRLGVRHEITVLTATWPGAQDRIDDGVHYVHIGRPWGYFGSLLTYFLALPLATWRRRDVDLVVEDFAAPFSSALAPLWSPRPVVAVVQWLNAREKSQQYKLPFFLVERLGVRLQDRYITVSQGIADRLREGNPEAKVWVVPNGVRLEELDQESVAGQDVVFLGRLENAQKGVDLLLEAFARVIPEGEVRLVLAGEGPDRAALERQVRDRGLDDRVDFIGWVNGREKAALLGSAAVLTMPSRFETFGIVAVEAQAAGTPVLAFDIPCLREVVPRTSGCLVPAYDVGRYAEALSELLRDPAHRVRMGRAGRQFARAFDWDRIADEQEAAYRAAFDPRVAD